jgi:hypothetical protein
MAYFTLKTYERTWVEIGAMLAGLGVRCPMRLLIDTGMNWAVWLPIWFIKWKVVLINRLLDKPHLI